MLITLFSMEDNMNLHPWP